MQTITLHSIGTVRSTRKTPTDDHWDAEQSSIELDPTQFSADALLGLSDFSHAEILFYLHQIDPANIATADRHPRNNPNWPKVGIFAQRAKNRPNQLAATICKILRIDGPVLHVAGLDAIDGTPVLDIKPWVKEFAPRGPVHQPQWTSELMQAYWS